MVKEKDAAIEKAMGFEAETEELNKVRYYWIEKNMASFPNDKCVIEFAGPVCIYNSSYLMSGFVFFTDDY